MRCCTYLILASSPYKPASTRKPELLVYIFFNLDLSWGQSFFSCCSILLIAVHMYEVGRPDPFGLEVSPVILYCNCPPIFGMKVAVLVQYSIACRNWKKRKYHNWEGCCIVQSSQFTSHALGKMTTP